MRLCCTKPKLKITTAAMAAVAPSICANRFVLPVGASGTLTRRNNAAKPAGMRCTVQNDAYHTVSALTFVTPSGAVIDTSKPDAGKKFALAEPQLAEGLLELRRELLADPALAERTRRKYAIRNTHGLRLCALLDGETPLEIFRRLLVGSEGTLAFIAEAVIETIPAPRVTSVACLR